MYECCDVVALDGVDISAWDTSHVTDMAFAFAYSADFNSDISAWDVGAVTNMQNMFYFAYAFNQNLQGWDVSSVGDMTYMFYYSGMSQLPSWCNGRNCSP